MLETPTYDMIIVGSGGGGLAAALTVAAAGGRPLVLEKTSLIGGSTAMSGGVLWVPDSQPAERQGASDSFDDGMLYLQSVVGNAGPASSQVRRSAFLKQGRELLSFLESEGLSFVFCDGYADYYDEKPGGKTRGRVLRAPMLPSKKLGDLYSRLRQFDGWKIPVNTNEFSGLTLAARTWGGRITALKVGARAVYERLTGQSLLCRGGALQGWMLLCAAKRDIPIWTDTPVTGLVVEDDRVVGVQIRTADGDEQTIRASHGVLLNGGGFARNAEMRRRYHPQPSQITWSASNPGDTGELIEMAIDLGAATDMLDEAIWIPLSLTPDGVIVGFHNPHDLAKPHCIAVDKTGQRFVNEAGSYMEFGQAMYRAGAVPGWVILDSRHRRYYPWGGALPGKTPPEWLSSGYMKKAGTIAELAAKCGIDPDGLEATVASFNRFARNGRDEDFGRGERVYDRSYGDPRCRPNPSLGTIERPPFYAVEIFPGDVGTFGGLMTDEHGAVMRADGLRLKGLYATGNCTASVAGRTYPGAGISIAASFIFGYAAAKDALKDTASSDWQQEAEIAVA